MGESGPLLRLRRATFSAFRRPKAGCRPVAARNDGGRRSVGRDLASGECVVYSGVTTTRSSTLIVTGAVALLDIYELSPTAPAA